MEEGPEKDGAVEQLLHREHELEEESKDMSEWVALVEARRETLEIVEAISVERDGLERVLPVTLTEAQRSQATDVYKCADRDGDGVLSREELLACHGGDAEGEFKEIPMGEDGECVCWLLGMGVLYCMSNRPPTSCHVFPHLCHISVTHCCGSLCRCVS